jgi:hypothetical protein
MAFEIVEFENNWITIYYASIQGRADELVIQAKELNYQNTISVKLSNLSLWHYAKTGYVKRWASTLIRLFSNILLNSDEANLVSWKILVLQC